MIFLSLLLLLGNGPQPPQYDVLIRDARVIDGAGNPWFRADIGILKGRIAAVGTLTGATARKTIEAAGRVLAPGFIDVHTHIEKTEAGGGIERVPRGDNYLRDGVTTVVTGNCGTSEVRIADWFAKLEKLGLGLNVATLIGHNSVRSAVMGSANRLATPEQIQRMQALIEQGMRDGAVGFSTGLLYVPGTYANTAEVVELAKSAASYGGVYASHIRDQGEKLLESITEAVTVGREAGMRVEISHFKVNARRLWGTSDKAIALVEKCRQEGIDVAVDQYPYDRASTSLSITVPTWALADGEQKVRERLRDPATRAKIIQGMRDLLTRSGAPDYSYATVASFPPDHSLEGKTITEINTSRSRKKSVEDEMQTILDMLEKSDAGMVYHTMSMEDVERILRYPNTSIGSDGGIEEIGVGVPHQRSYGTNARVLAEFVRQRKTISLEEGVRRMTSLPACRFGFEDRGLVREGLAADLVLFDPLRVQDKATYPNPHQFSEGFDYVLVNGTPVVENGQLMDVRPGQIMRHRQAAKR
jgi:N-acyl-D-amino-acid deacylase